MTPLTMTVAEWADLRAGHGQLIGRGRIVDRIGDEADARGALIDKICHTAAEAGFADAESKADPSQVIRVLVETVIERERQLGALKTFCSRGIVEANATSSLARGFAKDAYQRVLNLLYGR